MFGGASAFQNCCCQCRSLHLVPSPPPPQQETPPILAGSSGQSFIGSLLLSPWVLAHTKLCVCSPRVDFLFPPFLWNSCNQILLVSKVRVFGDYSSHWQTSDWKAWHELRKFTPVGEFLWYNFTSLWVSYLVGMRFHCAPSTILLWLLHCLWMYGYLFWQVPEFLSTVVQQLIVIRVFL